MNLGIRWTGEKENAGKFSFLGQPFGFLAKHSNRRSLRLGQALFLGFAITSGLFWLMQYMISNNQVVFEQSRDLSMVDFIRMKRQTELNVKERRLPEKPPPEKRPPPPRMEVSQANPLKNTPDFDMPDLDIPIQTDRFRGPIVSGLNVSQGSFSTNSIPLVRIPPRYPMRARMKRIEGWVKIEFSITEEGAVVDAIVVESHPRHVFDSEALRAISRWKFKPRIVGGEGVQQRAVQLLEFKLNN